MTIIAGIELLKKKILTNLDDILLDYRVHNSESFIKSRLQGLKTLLVQKLFKLQKKIKFK